MAQALRQEVETNDNAEAGSNIVVQVSANPGLVLLDRERFNQFYEAIKDETDKLVPDLTTERGRKEIASLAFKVVKTKTAIDAAGKAAEETARIAAEAKANEERLAQQKAHDEALAAEKRRADEAEAARKAQEAQALAAQQAAEREAEAQRKADQARAADREHRGKVMAAAKQAIMGHGVGEATAKAIVLAIAAGDVPAVSIRF